MMARFTHFLHPTHTELRSAVSCKSTAFRYPRLLWNTYFAIINPLLEPLLLFKDLFTTHPLFLVGLLLLLGYGVGKLAALARLPEITGFIVAGVLVGSFTTGIVTKEMNASLHIVTEVAIGFLALTIGGEFAVRKVRRIGRDVAVITGVNLLLTFSVVVLGCVLVNGVFSSVNIGYPYAILLGVIACATSPAVIAAEVHHLRARGRFVDYLLGVTALGDALVVVVFGFAFTLVINMLGAPAGIGLLRQSFSEIAFSFIAGIAGALVLSLVSRKIRNQNELMIITIGIIFLVTGVSIVLHLSPLLVNIAMGAALINTSSDSQKIFRAIEPMTPPIYALFFIIAGLEVNPAVFANPAALAAGGCYILLRGIGKYLGSFTGCALQKVDAKIRNYLGLCMFSKGGVALGFVLLIQTSPAMDAFRSSTGGMDREVYAVFTGLVDIVLMSIFLNELISPFLVRFSVRKGNEMEE